MATTPEAVAPVGFGTKIREFLEGVRAEMHKITWPDVPQIQDATIKIIVLVLAIGGIIALLDVALQAVFVRAIPSLFSR